MYEIGEVDGVHFIAMEYVRGETLSSRLRPRGIPIPDVITYAIQIADALDEAHGHGIIHRDLKPANAMITARGKLKILDFGLAKTVTADDKQDTMLSALPGGHHRRPGPRHARLHEPRASTWTEGGSSV